MGRWPARCTEGGGDAPSICIIGPRIRVCDRDGCGAAKQPDRQAPGRAADDHLGFDDSAGVAAAAAACVPSARVAPTRVASAGRTSGSVSASASADSASADWTPGRGARSRSTPDAMREHFRRSCRSARVLHAISRSGRVSVTSCRCVSGEVRAARCQCGPTRDASGRSSTRSMCSATRRDSVSRNGNAAKAGASSGRE
jgi:hypothetical protein